MAFKTSDFEIDERSVGEIGDIIQPHFDEDHKELEKSTSVNDDSDIAYDWIVGNKFKTIAFESVCSASRWESKDEIIICDSVSGVLRVVEPTYFQQVRFLNPERKLQCPVTVCVNNKTDQIFVGDLKSSKVFVFNEDFEYVTEFGHESIKQPFCLTIDEQTDHVYLTDKRNDAVTVWDSMENQSRFLTTFKCDTPGHIKVTDDKIYIVGGIFYELRKNTKQFRHITKGKNCIFIYAKQTQQQQSVISFPDWFDLRGLHVDKKCNLFTTTRYNPSEKDSHAVKLCRVYQDASLAWQRDMPYLADGFTTIRDMLFLEGKDVMFVRGKQLPPIQLVTFGNRSAQVNYDDYYNF